MGETPKDVITLSIRPIIVNDLTITRVVIDLSHINTGKAGLHARSDYDLDSIVKIIFELHEDCFEAEDTKNDFSYYSEIITHQGKNFKIVFCIPDTKDWLGVITLFRITKK